MKNPRKGNKDELKRKPDYFNSVDDGKNGVDERPEVCEHCKKYGKCNLVGHKITPCKSCDGECWNCLLFLDYSRSLHEEI